MSQTNPRIPWIDELRGLAILAMIVHHIAFNLIYFLNLPIPWLSAFMDSFGFHALQTLFVAVFLGLSGICCHLTRHPFKRALRVFLGALAVTIVTYIFYPEETIWFGVLHCLAVLMALFALLKKQLIRVPRFWGVLISAILFFVFFRLGEGQLLWWTLPKSLFRGGILTPLGLASPSFQSLDYVPLLPHMFLFSLGIFAGNGVLPQGKRHSRILAFCGRHSLLIYLLHQPVIFGLFFGLDKLL